MHLRRLAVLLTTAAVTLGTVGLAGPATASPDEGYSRAHFGNGNLPAGCIVSRDPVNPDNLCYHMKVGLNALDTPRVDVDVVVPVSPVAERDMRIAEQAAMMWGEGIDYLADEMDMPWLAKGFDINVRTHQVKVDPAGALAEPLTLVDPEIVIVVSNPAGGIGIGIDPVSFAGALGIVDGEGTPCATIPSPMSMKAWQQRPGFEQHGKEDGGTYVADCGTDPSSVGGNTCFAVNGAVDPVPGATDFFPLYDLVSHEFGHCLTLGHVGDGADGPWGPTPTNDIMAYSIDPPGINKCVSTLDVEGFALRMSNYLDVNGDGKVTVADKLVPNDVEGDGANSFQVQNPADHAYASATGDPADCPQPDLSAVPLAYGDFTPEPVATTTPRLTASTVAVRGGRLVVRGATTTVPKAKQPTRTSASATDATGDAVTPVSDLESVKVTVDKTYVRATMEVGQVWPVAESGSLVAYSLLVSGRRLDSFIPTASPDGEVVVMDNGTGYYLPRGTATWDADAGTVTFKVRRDYLADNQVRSPYAVSAITGIHARSNDWVATTDSVPDGKGLGVAGPAMGAETRDAPRATKVSTTRTTLTPAGGTSVTPADSSLGVGLVSARDTKDYLTMPVKQQATVAVTLAWEGTGTFGLTVDGGSAQVVKEGENSITVTVPWARRALSIVVDPQEILEPTTYTLTAKATTLVADADRDGVPDVADGCTKAAGPATGGGCPDRDGDGTFDKHDRCVSAPGLGANGCPTARDERVELLVDGKRVDTRSVMTAHGRSAYVFDRRVGAGSHRVQLRWIRDGKVAGTLTRTVR